MPLNDDAVFAIRRYTSSDRPAVRRICCLTALEGEPSAAFFDDDEVFADALTAYFTDYEPGSCLVAECAGRVVGYLTGAKDTGRMDSVFARRIALPLFAKAILRGVFFRRQNLQFLSGVFMSLVKGEFGSPDFSKDYPATLHVNVLKEFRASGLGSKMIRAYLDYLRAESVKGVRFATMSGRAGRFFRKLHFQELFQSKRSYFRYLLGNDVPVYVYGAKLM
jgi:GNAT superfamily N-acetyltransferase